MPCTDIQLLDYWTQITLDNIWKEQVQECIINHNNTGYTDDWDIVEYTPFTEPSWGIVHNK
jgi:hypothetical protein